ncbi:C4-dicarboxylate-binding protein DctP [Anaerovirgula multivorans]|uniref:C4-dicarboxylate-binding protein DctP n=1 Tax=Anaerovirgula multivorans TaxID=312168 RepID=A0A239BSW4_9FIRM|nr:TRAP transporter substrate-binding protein [Anaerovirgula multivorans]SNS10521.1 C4-dicarboxylate-binding protein DctP [Anaerovirgula multivorans]
MFKRNRIMVGAMVLILLISLLTGCGKTTSEGAPSGNGGTAEGDQQNYVIKFAHVVRPTTAKGMAAERFAELIEERSGGRIRVEVYPDSQLGTDQEITEQMQLGTIQMNAPFTAVLAPFVPQFQVFDLPFIFPDTVTASKAMNGDMGEKLNEYLIPAGLRGLGYWDGGFKHFTNSVRPIETPADIDGLKMRASQSQLLISQFRALNAGGISIPFAELYTALQNKTVDGQENPLSNIVSRKFYEVQDYLTLSSHGYLGYALVISNDFYENLPVDLQQMVEEVANEVAQWQWEKAAEEEAEYMKAVKESGIQISELTPENKDAFIEATSGVYDEFKQISGGEELLELLKGIRGY